MPKIRSAVAALLLAAGLAGCSASEAPSPSPSPSATPDPGAAVRAKIDAVLAEQSVALNEGDQAGFLAPAAGNAEVEAMLKKRFANLRALKVADVKQAVNLGPDPSGDPGRWNAQIRFDYCVGGSGCGVEGPVMSSAWQETSGGVKLVDLDATSYGPLPWEVDDLAVRTGKRVVVATTKAHAAELPLALSKAEDAAKVADRFAVPGSKPFRYVVYLAPGSHWKTWYSNPSPSSYGYGLPERAEGTDLVTRLDEVPVERSGFLLRHEMTRLAAMSHAPRPNTTNTTWWLSEGLNELAGANGASYPTRDDTRDHLRATPSYKGSLSTVNMSGQLTDKQINAVYGLAYYATTCIDEKYGRKKLLALVDAVLRNGEDTAAAGERVLGARWTTVESTCLTYTRRAVGL
ncbi:hypothetical protein AB0J82_25700 [Asanoa sp. NPDC049518]|uniref:hypothetical protein n=1 Tax=unclassified Asanoa TaxID=2685164 RepID=UPI0034227468